jgi:hypothetical protein
MPSYPQNKKSRVLLRCIRKHGKPAVAKLCSLMLDNPGVDLAYSLLSIYTELHESVVPIPGEVLDVTAKGIPHLGLYKEETHTLYKTLHGEFDHVHNSAGSNFQCMAIFMKMYSVLMSAKFR